MSAENVKREVQEWSKAVGDSIVTTAKQIKYLPSVETDRVLRHLKVSATSEVIGVSSMLSGYQQLIQTAVLEDYLKDLGFEVTEKAQFDLSEGLEKVAFEYVDIEIDVDKSIKAVGYGHIFIAHKNGRRFVLHLDEYGYERYKVKVLAKEGLQNEALELLTGLAKYAKEHNILKGKKITPHFRHIKLNETHTWDSVILPDATKKELRKNIDLLLRNVEVYKRNGMTFKRGLILKGPPGTGKTLIGKVLCNSIKDTTFIWVTPGDLGETRKIKAVCELARELSPSILFLEDVDLYGGHRERENRGVLGELMNQLDGLIENEFVIIVATTNRPDDVEDALRNRPGRFDRIIDVPLPDEACRTKMFKLFLDNVSVKVTDVDKLAERLAHGTDGYTGAHVRELINSAIISAIDEESMDKDGKVVLRIKHFKDNIALVKVKTIVATGFRSSNDDDDDVLTPSLEDLAIDD